MSWNRRVDALCAAWARGRDRDEPRYQSHTHTRQFHLCSSSSLAMQCVGVSSRSLLIMRSTFKRVGLFVVVVVVVVGPDTRVWPSHVFWLKWRLCFRPASISLCIHQAAPRFARVSITSYIVFTASIRMSRSSSSSRASARLGAVAHHLGCSAAAGGAASAPPPRLLAAAAAASAGPSSIPSTSAIPSTGIRCSCSSNTSSSSHQAQPHPPRTMASSFKQEPHKLLGARERATRRLLGCAGGRQPVGWDGARADAALDLSNAVIPGPSECRLPECKRVLELSHVRLAG